MKTFISFIMAAALAATAIPAPAGNLTPPGAPSAGSALPTLSDIYNQLATGATNSIPGTFQGPSAGPGATGRSLSEIKAKLPVADNVNGATAADVKAGKTFWGLRTDGTWGVKSGTTNPVNASGITTWSNADTNGLTAPPAGFPRQDADNIRNWFSFTKLDAATGSPLSSWAISWGCVRDDITGLTWENKTTDSGLHHNAWTYTWNNSDAATNGGFVGTPSGGSCGGTVAAGCDTEKFVAAVNSAGWCGFSDWRMPTVEELRSIVNLGRVSPAISVNWFPNTQSPAFWSGSPFAGGSYYAWSVYFYHGYDSFDYKSNSYYVRLVRGGQ